MPSTHTSMKRTFVVICFLCCIAAPSKLIHAQFTETFENITFVGTIKTKLFNSNSQPFILSEGACDGGTIGIFIPGQVFTNCAGQSQTSSNSNGLGVGINCTGGNCSGTSNKFIDNGLSLGTNHFYSLKTNDSALFTIKSLFLYLSSDYGDNGSQQKRASLHL